MRSNLGARLIILESRLTDLNARGRAVGYQGYPDADTMMKLKKDLKFLLSLLSMNAILSSNPSAKDRLESFVAHVLALKQRSPLHPDMAAWLNLASDLRE